MINTFLFDLDGTLLSMEWDIFEKAYMGKLSSKLINHFNPDFLIKSIWKSTMKTIDNRGGERTNKEVFFEDFTKTTGKSADLLLPIFDEFYLNEYDELKQLAVPEEYIIKTIDVLKARGYDLIIATNPVFPLEAIIKRIRWAGLDERWFKYITCYENMHYCKPNVEFYGEVLERISRNPDECIMVGNDVEEDMIASKIGIKTFLIENHIIDRKEAKIKPDYRGNYEDFYRIVCQDFLTVNRKVEDESAAL